VSFMHPLDPKTAAVFWKDALAAAARDERVVLGAWDGETLAGAIPDYALKPHGGLTGTLIYWKRIGVNAERNDSRAQNVSFKVS